MTRSWIAAAILFGMLEAAASAMADWPPDATYIGPSGYDTYTFKLLPDGAGGVLAFWRERGPDGQTHYNMRAVRITPDAVSYNWDNYFSHSTNYSYTYPDGLGGAFLAYRDYCCPDTAWQLRHIPPGGGFDPSWPVNGVPIAPIPTLSYYHFPWVQGDGAGGAFVVFRSRNADGSAGNALFVRHVLPDGTVDPAWPAAGVRINGSDGPTYSASPFVTALDGAGGVIIVWIGDYFGGALRAQRVTGAGTIAPGWPAAGRLLIDSDRTTAEDFPLLSLVPSGSDHFLVAWGNVEEGGAECISVQRFHRAGTIAAGWPTSGLLVHTFSTTYATANARMISDGATGAYVAWVDEDASGSTGILRGVRLDEDGSIADGWTAPDGRLLAYVRVFTREWTPSFDITMSNSQLVVTFAEQATPWGLRTTWFLGSGSPDPGQPLNGRVITPADRRPYHCATISDGHGGVYVGWDDITPTIPGAMKLTWVPYDPSLVDVAPTFQTHPLDLVAWPNPARDGLEVRFALTGATPARLELLDVIGRRIRSLEVRGSGAHVAKLTNLRGVAPGVYLLRLEQGNSIRTTRVALIH